MIHDLPGEDSFQFHVATSSPADTSRLAGRIAGLLTGGEVILLWGGLGAGKTFFVQGLCRALGGDAEVVSPTFTLASSYPCGLQVHHLDLFRLESGDDLSDLGVEAILDEVESGSAVLLVEWPGPLLDWLDGRIEILATAGADPDSRVWHLRGIPKLPEVWRDHFEAGAGDA